MSRWQIQNFAAKLHNDCELRAHENRVFRIQMINGQLVGNQRTSSGGLSARAYRHGAWGFASVPDISLDAADRVLSFSEKNANILAKRRKGAGANLTIANARGQKDAFTGKPSMSPQELLGFLNRLDEKIKTKYPDLKSRSIILQQQDFEKELITTGGANCYSRIARSYIYIIMGMESPYGPVDLMRILGGMGQIEDTLPSNEEIDRTLEELYRHLKDKAAGVVPSAGVKDVILHSKLAGILAHEAIGHTTEADLVLGGSVAAEYLGKSVASPLVSLVDFAHTVNGKPCPLPVYFDDEGMEAHDTVIIENGILKNYMHSRESAARFGHTATGHSRAWGFNDEPLIRMRNTAILPGKDRLEDMIASVEDGYYLMDHGNGQADSTSEFMFGVTLGYEIKNGKLGRGLLNTTVSGVAFDMLKTVSMVSNEMTWVSSGTCGKKQPMTVGMGGPAVKCRINIGGK